jgi:hypothetical protein
MRLGYKTRCEVCKRLKVNSPIWILDPRELTPVSWLACNQCHELLHTEGVPHWKKKPNTKEVAIGILSLRNGGGAQ